MNKKSKEEIYKIREIEYLEYIKTHNTIPKDAKFTDGTLIASFEKFNRIKLEKNEEAQQHIEQKIQKNRNQLERYIELLQEKEKEIISTIEDLPKEFKNLSQIEKVIFYRNCLLTPITKKESYIIDNITISKDTLKIIKKLYLTCYATYPEKEYFKKNDIAKENTTETDLETLKYLNDFCTSSKWQKNKIETLETRYNLPALEIKNLAIKYRYLTIYPQIAKQYNFKKSAKGEVADFIINQIFAYTTDEIINTKAPTTNKDKNAYSNYKQSDKEAWLKLENFEGLPQSEKAKIIINVEAKTNIYIKYQNKLKEDKQLTKKRKLTEEKIEEANHYMKLYLKEKPKNIKLFCKKHDITENRFNKLSEIIKETNASLYEEFTNFTIKEQKKQIKQAEEAIKTILQNKEDENFTIFDYYEESQMDLLELKSILPKFNLEEKDDRTIRTFISKHLFLRPLTKKEKQNYIETEHTLLDKNDIPHTPTKEEKEQILTYLEEHNRPLKNTYIIALNRYINGELNLEKQTNRKK